MSCVEKIINTVMQAMHQIIDDSKLKILENVLVTTLYEYEVTEKTTDVAVVNENVPMSKLNQFIATKRVEGKSEKTLEYYYNTLSTFIIKTGKNLNDYTTIDLRYYLACYKSQRHVTNTTINNIRKILSSFFGWLADEEIIQKNPTRKLKKVKEELRVNKVLSEQELEMLRINCENKRDRALIEFLYSTGCRVSEVENLRIENIDFDNNECVVLGKGNKERIVYFTDAAKLHLQNYLETRVNNKTGALFASLKNQFQPLMKSGIEAAVRRLGIKSGVNKVTPHRFRHTLTTVLVNRGINIQDMQVILGHKNIQTTQIYFKNNKRNVKYAYMKIA